MFVTARGVSGVEVAGNHDADRFDPTGDISHRVEAAFGEHVIVVILTPLFTAWLVIPVGILNAEEIKPLVVFVVPSGNRSEVIATAPGEA